MLRGFFILLVRLLTGASAVWQGCEPRSGKLRIYFANHGSHLDFVTLWAALPEELRGRTRGVAARDYWGGSRFRRFVAADIFNALLIRREGITKDDNPVAQMEAALRAGDSLIIFPEGTRSRDGTIGTFKPGLYHLAARVPEAELVPVFLQNLNRILPKGHLLPIPLISTVVFGRPLRIEEGEGKKAFMERAQATVSALGQGNRPSDARGAAADANGRTSIEVC
ncbi:MAG: 1-acyl-sn-glycerol-3-phosphate acyltransferase [Verrucomicrobiaceae bacterium]|nr:1-acyl-sn-glycerol-3-phosphate acyltransferase [Verrucomicrobiaceae bacterium]